MISNDSVYLSAKITSMAFQKGNKLYSILWHKCPKCHEGDLYPTSLWTFSKLFTMKDKCDHCGQPYVLEPGFYWGSMYISYMLSSGLMLTTFAILYFIFDLSVTYTFVGIIAIAAVFYGLIFRLARSVWINIYVHYDESKAKKG